MFSMSGANNCGLANPPAPHSHPNLPEVGSHVPPVPSAAPNPALSRIEHLLESVVDALATGRELVIPYQTVRSTQNGEDTQTPGHPDRPAEVVRFPARTVQEAKKFEAIFRILETSHEALLAGNIITKRNLFYQNPDLFKTQSTVDDMVDNLAFTLGVGREDLNIVAAAKGLIFGPIDLVLRDGSVHSCDAPGDTGMLLPSVASVQRINFRHAQWLLVIEKEATFRTLAAAQYHKILRAGHGILLTAKGFPDLATRRFLSLIHNIRPGLPLLALVDYDPDGVAILRTYKYGSRRLDHEQNATTPQLRWLGIRSDDILSDGPPDYQEVHDSSQSQASQEFASQDPAAYSCDGSQNERPVKRARVNKVQRAGESTMSPLTQRDRRRAVQIMRAVCGADRPNRDEADVILQLQRMLMLNIKAEIQAVDNYGDIADWLDEKLVVCR
ncbi:Spo11/DNA topoisomerase VI subunit A [Staphylotrichum tortipilum]|uniref:DNA topoisomerase (ATP-hydrolyzing) n=1 Tax=Staphylotrichum tortipilum TaxID=2831512 RepID=A0AAN6RSK5_9PEZI|nr:Spo11/DNA topoisomerase VI subunit A [Staphylotrichum longicolle]